ncbi:MAG: response regulator [Kordiimonadaceae bacterium]|nr:response regulator [Kordiimonadaceae bacterium]
MAKFSDLKVMVLDDEPFITSILFDMLDDLGVQTKEKYHSVEEANTSLENFAPNVVLSDIDMPDTDGFQFIKKARVEHPHINQAAIVFLTGHSDPAFIKKAKALGVAGYLLKPVKYDRLRANLTRVHNALTASGRL